MADPICIPVHPGDSSPPSFDSVSDIGQSEESQKLTSAALSGSRAFQWSRRIVISTESIWLKKVRRHKLRTCLLLFFPSAAIFLLAFFLAPAAQHSKNNDLKFYLGGVSKPNMQFTAGIIPKRFHSHDDFKQCVPLLTALSYGATSLDISVWEVNGQLLVGEDWSALSSKNTLNTLYLEPLNWLLGDANSDASTNMTSGVYATAPYVPLQLLIDVRGDGVSGYNLLQETLEPFYRQGYLTSYNMSNPNATLDTGVLTIIATGNVPVDLILTDNDDVARYIFYDAPLGDLDSTEVNYTMTLSPTASASWDSTIGASWVIPSLGRKKIKRLTDLAHARGIQTRFSGTPDIPNWLRNYIWQMLLDQGADLLDVEDLYAASQF